MVDIRETAIVIMVKIIVIIILIKMALTLMFLELTAAVSYPVVGNFHLI